MSLEKKETSCSAGASNEPQPEKAKGAEGNFEVSSSEDVCGRCMAILQNTEIEEGLQISCYSLQEDSLQIEDQLQDVLTEKYKHGNVYLIFHLSDRKQNDHKDAIAEVLGRAEDDAKKNNLGFKQEYGEKTVFVTIRCPSCCKAVKDTRYRYAEVIFCLHMDVAVVNGREGRCSDQEKRERKLKRRQYISDFIQIVCALRNSGGGIIIVHLLGKEKDDFYVGFFDEMVADSLQRILNPEELFIDAFCRERWSSSNDNNANNDLFVLFHVSQNSTFSTGDFKTKIPLDDKLIDPTSSVISSILSDKREVFERSTRDTVSAVGNPSHHEDRHLQLKRFKDESINDVVSVQQISSIMWSEQKLGENISAFAKVAYGGTYICGIKENKVSYDKYKTIKTEEIGIPLPQENHTELQDALTQMIGTQMTAINKEYIIDESFKDYVTVTVKPYEVNNDKCIVKVKVSQFPGLVFYDRLGPESYRYDEKTRAIRRLQFQEWLIHQQKLIKK